MDGNASVEEDHNSHQVDPALQSTLKRVSREIQLRKTGWKDCKQPLPPVSGGEYHQTTERCGSPTDVRTCRQQRGIPAPSTVSSQCDSEAD